MIVKKTTFILVLTLALGLLAFACLRRGLPGDQEKVSEPAPSTQIAIVLDDWGYSLKNLAFLFKIESPVTVSILPNVLYSRKIATAVSERKNFEIIVHLPLEPEKTKALNLEPTTIYTSMSEPEITSIFREALKSVPGAVGISNHMGSRATQNRTLMSIIFSRIREQKLFFLDSLVSKDSICRDLSQEMKIRFTERSVFLDNENDPEYIKQQLNQLVLKSKSKGSAVGIGHGRETTLKVLAEMMPELEKQGIEFVYVSKLAK